MHFYFAVIFALVGIIFVHTTLYAWFGSDLEHPSYEVRSEIQRIIAREAERYGVDVNLALFLADVESNFNPYAKNPNSSATGLFQFIDGTWRKHCEGTRTDPEDNTRCAMKLLSAGDIGHWTVEPRTRAELERAGFLQ